MRNLVDNLYAIRDNVRNGSDPYLEGSTIDAKELEQLKAQRTLEYERDLEAIERVYRISEGLKDKALPVEQNNVAAKEGKSGRGGKRGWLKKAVKKFIDHATGKFTMLDIVNHLLASGEKRVKKQSVKSTLHVFERAGFIETIKRGAGRTPSEYRKK